MTAKPRTVGEVEHRVWPERAAGAPRWRMAMEVGVVGCALLMAVVVGRVLAEREVVRSFTGSDLGWQVHGELEWSAEEVIVRAWAGDPWLEVLLPQRAVPVVGVSWRVQLLAPWNPGARVYWVPRGDPLGEFREVHAGSPVEVDLGHEHRELRFTFDRPADRVRLDPPDWAQFRIDRVEVRALPWSGAVGRFGPLLVVVVAWAVWGAWRGSAVWGGGARVGRTARPAPLLVAAGLAGVKLWLVAAQPLGAIGVMPHDDTLFLDRAEHLLAGRWLGPYDQYVLAKGPGFPLWLAASHALGVPLRVGQHLGYLLAAALLAGALRPVVTGRWAPVALFAWLAFNPLTFSGDDTRVLRHDVATIWAVVSMAGLAGAWLRPELSAGRVAAWCGVAGLALGMSWITREEAVWLMPGALFVAGAIVWRKVRSRRWAGVRTALGAVALPLTLGWAVPVGWVCAQNAAHYGWWGTVEFRSREMKAAYGALLRVEPEQWQRFVPVPRETRQRIYAVSPAFASLRDHFEGSGGEGWARLGEGVTGRPASDLEIHGAGFVWALRDAVVWSGHGGSAREALDFYAQLAAEVNGAVEAGLLRGGARRTGFLPPWRPEYTRDLPGNYGRALDRLWRSQGWRSEPRRSEGEPDRLAWVSGLTRERVAPPAGVAWERTASERGRLAALEVLSRPYRVGLRWLWAVGVLAFFAAVVVGWRRRRLPVSLVLAAAMGGSCLALCGIVALVDTTTFSALTLSYLAPAYPLALVFPWLAVRAAGEVIRSTGRPEEGAG